MEGEVIVIRIGVCGIACEKCPNGNVGCVPKDNPHCKVAERGHLRGVRLCFECPDFPCETTGPGPTSRDYCVYTSGRAE
ncbi:MAG: hypothetical protein QXQ13_01020 [Thermoplasmata archaeon]